VALAAERRRTEHLGSLWWLGVLVGILYLFLGFFILSFDADSLLTVSILIGISFMFTGFAWLTVGMIQRQARWWFAIGGILAFVAGIIAFAYPGETLVVLGLLLGWFLLVAGIVDIVDALASRDRDLWWVGLLQGIAMLIIGVWAAGEDTRSVFLLVTLTGVFCVIRGIGDILGAFLLRRAARELAA
jgi:uncharacterized membrane protein HdeD (DUF308 family)